MTFFSKQLGEDTKLSQQIDTWPRKLTKKQDDENEIKHNRQGLKYKIVAYSTGNAPLTTYNIPKVIHEIMLNQILRRSRSS